jgi:hypothetical protein
LICPAPLSPDQGYDAHVSQPTLATSDVSLAVVQGGEFLYGDISNVQMSYLGLTFDNSIVSSIGNDFGVFVNPVSDALIFHDIDQGLALIAFAGADINATTTFLSITIDSALYNLSTDIYLDCVK